MILIDMDNLDFFEKYFDKDPTPEVVEKLVDELSLKLDKITGYETEIYQDIDNPTYYRIYAGCCAVEVYLEDNKIQVDFDNNWQIRSSETKNTSQKTNQEKLGEF